MTRDEKKRRGNWKRKNQDVRRSKRNTGVKIGSERCIKTASKAHLGKRACLSQTITALVKDPEKRSSFLEGAIKSMPEGRNVCPPTTSFLRPPPMASLWRGAAKTTSCRESHCFQHILREVDCALVLNVWLGGSLHSYLTIFTEKCSCCVL